MKPVLAIVLTAFLALPVWAEEPAFAPKDGTVADLNEFLWKNRPLVVFADSPADPRFEEQIRLLEEDQPGLETRDVVVLVDTDPAAKSALRQKLRPRGFMMVVLAKDGSVILRKPLPWHVREIGRAIDKQPLRQQEIRDSHGSE
ncbi:DUF4174 domain-containing protein [Thalassovita sp.]|uniref:DUF4174 domain-containing protein n=1 Tax=Thalassovita sp. TaxID=1979401 RepID=UPI002882046F|nr:DUF4174 domain-containing protein [Thalassovita sp.]MDF1801809.1 DUF4174 domain-containing protein [Thalassovita sp.]